MGGTLKGVESYLEFSTETVDDFPDTWQPTLDTGYLPQGGWSCTGLMKNRPVLMLLYKRRWQCERIQKSK